MSFGDAWHDDSSGDMHFWSVWHEGKDFEHYRDVSPRFCSEFGFQSYPSMNVIRRFADERDFNIASPVMESHQKSTRGNARIAETMFRYFRFPVDFENFVYLSQIQQGLAIKTAITHWRSLKPHCMGTLIWQLNDTWPVCSWSSLDHGGGWKLLHHMAKHFYAPVTVAVQPTADAYKLVAVNDTRHPVSVHVDIFALSVSGTLRSLGDSMVTVTPDAAEPIIAIPTDALMEQEMLWFRWSDENGATQQECFAPQRFKSYDLQPANIQLSVEKTTQGYELTLSAEKPAFFTAVESSTSGRFSNNAFTLLPEDPTTITFVPDTPGPTPDFVVRDLHSATYSSSG
jgi:beta-mannosidase